MKKNSVMIKEGEKVKVDPRLTGLDEWIEGTVIDIEHNPFKGLVIAIRDKFNRIFFGEQKYFIPVNEDNVCMQQPLIWSLQTYVPIMESLITMPISRFACY